MRGEGLSSLFYIYLHLAAGGKRCAQEYGNAAPGAMPYFHPIKWLYIRRAVVISPCPPSAPYAAIREYAFSVVCVGNFRSATLEKECWKMAFAAASTAKQARWYGVAYGHSLMAWCRVLLPAVVWKLFKARKRQAPPPYALEAGSIAPAVRYGSQPARLSAAWNTWRRGSQIPTVRSDNPGVHTAKQINIGCYII